MHYSTGAMKVLQQELTATMVPPEASTSYRLNLAYALFYKVCVMYVHDNVFLFKFMSKKVYVELNSFHINKTSTLRKKHY